MGCPIFQKKITGVRALHADYLYAIRVAIYANSFIYNSKTAINLSVLF